MNQKFALLIGINYYDHPENKLNGCINDIKMMRNYLIQNKGYLNENITVLRDDNTTFEKPTRNTILSKMNQLIEKANVNNSAEIFFHYSGHGTFQKDKNGDEVDKRDELIVPCDLLMISDDEIRNIFNKLNSNTTLYTIMDCCHSGTNVDLPYIYNTNKLTKSLILEQNNTKQYNSMLNKKIYSISGCKDTQTSADASNVYKVYNDTDQRYNIESSNLNGGALTSILLELLKSGKYTFINILNQLQTNLINKGFSQLPLLSTTVNLIQSKPSGGSASIIKPPKKNNSKIKKNKKNRKVEYKFSILNNTKVKKLKYKNSFIKRDRNIKY